MEIYKGRLKGRKPIVDNSKYKKRKIYDYETIQVLEKV